MNQRVFSNVLFLCFAGLLTFGLIAAGCMSPQTAVQKGPSPTPAAAQQAVPPEDIHKIQHIIIIMQENRAFDEVLRDVPRR